MARIKLEVQDQLVDLLWTVLGRLLRTAKPGTIVDRQEILRLLFCNDALHSVGPLIDEKAVATWDDIRPSYQYQIIKIAFPSGCTTRVE